MKRICLIHWGLGEPGGGQRVCIELANALQEMGYSVAVLSLNYCSNSYYRLKDEIQLFSIKEEFRVRDILRPRVFVKIYTLIKENRFDIMLTVGTGYVISLLPAVFQKNIKIIISEHTSYNNCCEKGWKNDINRYLGSKIADKIIYLTKDNMEIGHEKYKIPYFKQVVIPNFFYDSLGKACDEVIYDEKSKVIITAGVYDRVKGYDMLVDIAKDVLLEHKEWRWHVYGNKKDLKYFYELECRRKMWDNDNQLSFFSATSDIFEKYKTASLYVLTSYNEGFPMALLEAKMFKLPIVSFDCQTGPSELVEDGKSGYLINCYDKEAMKRKICDLIVDDDMRKSFSKHSRDNIEKYRKNNVLSEWIKILEG